MAAAALIVLLLAVAAPVLQSQTALAAGAEKETHIKLYWHDVYSGPSPTAVQVAQAATASVV